MPEKCEYGEEPNRFLNVLIKKALSITDGHYGKIREIAKEKSICERRVYGVLRKIVDSSPSGNWYCCPFSSVEEFELPNLVLKIENGVITEIDEKLKKKYIKY